MQSIKLRSANDPTNEDETGERSELNKAYL
jgi:hypothetical protein